MSVSKAELKCYEYINSIKDIKEEINQLEKELGNE